MTSAEAFALAGWEVPWDHGVLLDLPTGSTP